MLKCDVIIVGGGLSGCIQALAVLMFSPKLRIILIDENALRLSQAECSEFDARSIALSVGSCALLNEIGLWVKIKNFTHPIDEIKISDQGNLGGSTLLPENKHYGVVVKVHDISAVLESELQKLNSDQLVRMYNTRVTSIEKTKKTINCLLSNKQIIKAKLCVAADGGNSDTRKLLAIKSRIDDYHCSSIIANIKLKIKNKHKSVAFERFTASGPIALLPLADECYSLVYCVANTDAQAIMSLDEGAFLDEIQSQFGFRAGIFTQVGKRSLYPLKLVSVDDPITHRGVCIGNAAHNLHPVMGQGFNLGLRDLYVLAKVISDTPKTSLIGDFDMLNRYWLAREKDHFRTINMTDSIVRLFSNQSPLFKMGRTLGLFSMSCATFLSQPIVKQAKGIFDLFVTK